MVSPGFTKAQLMLVQVAQALFQSEPLLAPVAPTRTKCAFPEGGVGLGVGAGVGVGVGVGLGVGVGVGLGVGVGVGLGVGVGVGTGVGVGVGFGVGVGVATGTELAEPAARKA